MDLKQNNNNKKKKKGLKDLFYIFLLKLQSVSFRFVVVSR